MCFRIFALKCHHSAIVCQFEVLLTKCAFNFEIMTQFYNLDILSLEKCMLKYKDQVSRTCNYKIAIRLNEND